MRFCLGGVCRAWCRRPADFGVCPRDTFASLYPILSGRAKALRSLDADGFSPSPGGGVQEKLPAHQPGYTAFHDWQLSRARGFAPASLAGLVDVVGAPWNLVGAARQ